MNALTLFTPDVIEPSINGMDRDELIQHLLGMLDAAGKLLDPDLALQDVLAREQRLSTAQENGLAFPHARTTAVGELVAAVAISQKGIDFRAADGEKSHIIILSLSPTSRPSAHMHFIADLAKRLEQQNLRRDLLAAHSAILVSRFLCR